MTVPFRSIAVLFAVLIAALLSPTHADNCRVVRRVVQQKVIVQEKVAVVAPIVQAVAVAVPVAIQVPLYQYANHAPHPCPPAVQQEQRHDKGAELDRLADLLFQRIEQRLTSGPPPAISESAKLSGYANGHSGSNAVRILAANCARCHSGTASNGGGRVMFDSRGELVQLSQLDRWQIFDASHTGRMPKNAKSLTDEETAELQTWAREGR